MTEREVSSERVSEERCQEIADGLAAMSEMPVFAQGHRSILLTAAAALRSSVKTVPEALEQLRAAIKAADADKSRRNELLATLLVNIEKNEPTAEFAVALRDFVREERPKLSAIEAPAAEGEERELTAVEKLAVSMTDEKIANALYEECETILQLLIYSREGEVASHVGAIKSWAGMLRGRAERMPKSHPSPAAPSEVTEDRVILGAQKVFELFCGKPIDWSAEDIDSPESLLHSADWAQAIAYSRAALKGGK